MKPHNHNMKNKDLGQRASNFALQAAARFKNRFDYRQMKYKNSATPVEIVCPKHGSFLQTPVSHLNSKHGCPDCAKEFKWPDDEPTILTPERRAKLRPSKLRRVHRLFMRGNIEAATFAFLNLVQEDADLKTILRDYINSRKPDHET